MLKFSIQQNWDSKNDKFFREGYSMQYIRPPFGPKPSSSITSSSEMSSLMSAANISKLILELRQIYIALISTQITQNFISTHPQPLDSQNSLQQDLGSQYGQCVVWSHNVDTNQSSKWTVKKIVQLKLTIPGYPSIKQGKVRYSNMKQYNSGITFPLPAGPITNCAQPMTTSFFCSLYTWPRDQLKTQVLRKLKI